MTTHYDILGIARDCSDEDIRKAYRKKAMKYHPDKNPDNLAEATEMFKKVAEAYEILSDRSKRQEYDNELSGANQYPRGFSTGSSSASSRGRPSHHDFHRAFSEQRAFDLFNNFFAEFDNIHDQFLGGGRAREARDPFAHHSQFMSNFMNNDPFMADFASGGLGGHGSMFSRTSMGGGGGGQFVTSSMSSSSSFVGGAGRSGTSTSSTSFIDPSGRRITRTETTTYHPDGTKETTSQEFIDGEPTSNGRNRISDGSRNQSSSHAVATSSSSFSSSSSSSSSSSRGGAPRSKY